MTICLTSADIYFESFFSLVLILFWQYLDESRNCPKYDSKEWFCVVCMAVKRRHSAYHFAYFRYQCNQCLILENVSCIYTIVQWVDIWARRVSSCQSRFEEKLKSCYKYGTFLKNWSCEECFRILSLGCHLAAVLKHISRLHNLHKSVTLLFAYADMLVSIERTKNHSLGRE